MTQQRKGRAPATPASDITASGVDAGNAPPDVPKDPAPVVDLVKDPIADGVDNPSVPAAAEDAPPDVPNLPEMAGEAFDPASVEHKVGIDYAAEADYSPEVLFSHDLTIKNTGRTRFESITKTKLVSGQTIVVPCATAAIRHGVLKNIAQYNHLSGANVLTIVDGSTS